MTDGKDVQKWADDAMFEAEELDASSGPSVFLLSCNPDPLGSIAAAAKAYKGEFVSSLAEITDAERRHFLAEIQKTALAMPLEAVNFHFRISGVTRGFTHQMVRQRTAAYSQESTRFAVKSGVPVGLPPSLEGTDPKAREKLKFEAREMQISNQLHEIYEWTTKYMSVPDQWREIWDGCVDEISLAYNTLVNAGMPAEDARGLLPTNLLTQINYITNLRNFKEEAGKRLCTQAQFEWRIVFSKMMEAIREFGKIQSYVRPWDADDEDKNIWGNYETVSSKWQFDAIADLFRPICYYKGSCQFKAEFDRNCRIRERVDANAAINRPSSEWGTAYSHRPENDGGPTYVGIEPIQPEEWLLDPGAAR